MIIAMNLIVIAETWLQKSEIEKFNENSTS